MKFWYLFGLVLFSLSIISCGGDKTDKTSSSSSAPKKEIAKSDASEQKASEQKTNRKGKLIYKQYCVACHGADGKLSVSGAKDLSKSTVDMAERINQITNGKGMMTPYKDVLTKTQIQDVAEYLDELIEG